MRALAVLAAALALACGSAAAEVPCLVIISSNDTAFALAQTYNLTLPAVAEANPDIDNLDLLQPGQVVALPCGNASATSGTSVLDLLAHNAEYTTLFRAVVAAGFAETLADPELEATVFAPNNTAFEDLLERLGTNTTLESLLTDPRTLGDLLSYHVVPGQALQAAQLTPGLNLTTLLEGEFLEVFKPGNITRLATSSGQRARILATDLEAGQAVVHQVKGVLVPASLGLDVAPTGDECVHTVVSGDTLFALAQRYGTTVAALIELNPELEENPTLLPLGTRLALSEDCAALGE